MTKEYSVPLQVATATIILSAMFFGFYPSVREWVTKEKVYGNGEKAVYALVAGGLSLGVSSCIQRPLQRLQRRITASQDMTDQLLVQRQWDNANEPTQYNEEPVYLAPMRAQPQLPRPMQSVVTPLKAITYRSNAVSQGVVSSDIPTLVVGNTGGGKTTMLFTIICEALNLGYRAVVFDGKPMSPDDNVYLGFGDKITYVPFKTPSDTPHFVNEFNKIADEMQGDEPSTVKTLVIVDEINNAITKAELFVNETNSKGKENQRIKLLNALILTQGRQRGYITVGTTHDPAVSSLGMSSNMRSNFKFILLGSPKHRDVIENILNAVVELIPDEQRRKQLFSQYRENGYSTFDGFYVLSNVIGGNWDFYVTDDHKILHKEKPQIPADTWSKLK